MPRRTKPKRVSGALAQRTGFDRFSYNCGVGVRETVAGLSGHSLTAKVGNKGCWSGCLYRSPADAQTDRRASTALIISPDIVKVSI